MTSRIAHPSFLASHRIVHGFEKGAPMQRVIAGFAIVFLGITSPGYALDADDTRAQHRDWMRKLETPGGTFPEALDMIIEHADPGLRMPDGTGIQHRSWIRKLETPNGTL